MTATSRTTGTVAQVVVTLAPAVGFVASGYAYIDVPTDGVDQDVRVTFDYFTDNNTDLYLSQFVLFEDDPLQVAVSGLAAEDGSALVTEDSVTILPE